VSVCERCGEEHTRCSAPVFRDGTTRPCGRFPNRGITVCHVHGAASPQAKAKAAQRLAEAEVLARYPRRTSSEVLLEAAAVADARARAAVDAGAPDTDELREKAGALAKTVIDKLGPAWEVNLEAERVKMQVAGVRAGMDALHSSSLIHARCERLPCPGHSPQDAGPSTTEDGVEGSLPSRMT
jgi:hypothetical protein